MSWWVHLVNKKDKTEVKIPLHQEGGTYMLGGNTRAELNITYNYSPFYYQHLDEKEGLRWLNDKKAKDCLKKLEYAVQALGIERSNDYWKPTAGNAGYALSIIAAWAVENPNAIFTVD